jgi:hypothetical protein
LLLAVHWSVTVAAPAVAVRPVGGDGTETGGLLAPPPAGVDVAAEP